MSEILFWWSLGKYNISCNQDGRISCCRWYDHPRFFVCKPNMSPLSLCDTWNRQENHLSQRKSDSISLNSTCIYNTHFKYFNSYLTLTFFWWSWKYTIPGGGRFNPTTFETPKFTVKKGYKSVKVTKFGNVLMIWGAN